MNKPHPSEDIAAREKLFTLLHPMLLDTQMEAIEAAYKFSFYGHINQTRDDGSSYFYHPLAVATIASETLDILDEKIIITALLHDIPEDQTILSEYRIALNFGSDVALWVKLLTKEKGVDYHQRLKRCRIWQVLLVKLCDRVHNLLELGNCTLKKQIKKLAETQEHYFERADILIAIMPPELVDRGKKLKEMMQTLCDTHAQRLNAPTA